MVKHCAVCKTEKDFTCFHKNKSRSDGYSHVCKECRKQHSKDYNNTLDHAEHYKKHSSYYKRKATYRKESVRVATPIWLTLSQKQEIDIFYDLAKDCQIVTGEDYHVDHIVPLKGKNVCGLHVAWNLQVLPSDVNIVKSNKFTY